MGILAKILGTGDVISKGLDLIDSFHVSDVEEFNAKTDAKTELLTAYAPFKVTQRYLALMFCGTFLFSFFLTLCLTLAGVGNVEVVRDLLSEFYIGEIMLTIIVFYFGGGFVEGAVNTHKKKR